MRVYYSTHISATHIEDYMESNSPDEMECFYIIRMVETDTGETYKDEIHEAIWNWDAYGFFTKREAEEKSAELNKTLDSSKSPMTEFEKLEKDCQDRDSLKTLIDNRKTELAKLEKQLEKLDFLIKLKQSHQEAPTQPPVPPPSTVKNQQENQEIPTARNLKFPID